MALAAAAPLVVSRQHKMTRAPAVKWECGGWRETGECRFEHRCVLGGGERRRRTRPETFDGPHADSRVASGDDSDLTGEVRVLGDLQPGRTRSEFELGAFSELPATRKAAHCAWIFSYLYGWKIERNIM